MVLHRRVIGRTTILASARWLRNAFLAPRFHYRAWSGPYFKPLGRAASGGPAILIE